MEKINSKELINKIEENSIDVFISSASYEDRCFVIPNTIENLPLKEKVYFYISNEIESVSKNANLLVEIDKGNSKKIELNSYSPVQNYRVIYDYIDKITKSKNKPNILIDTTTFTRESLLVLIRILSLRKEYIGEIFCSYVGAKEYSVNVEKDTDKWLSKGIDEIRSIIGYPGFTDPTQKNHLVILFGFEYNRTKELIKSYEYDFISIGFGHAERSVNVNHQKINSERHQRLVNEYPNSKIFNFSLIDHNESKKQILEYLDKEHFKKLNTVIAPMNNKISTIGAALAAMENEDIQISYIKPSVYNTEGYSVANDDIYFFELEF